MKPFFAITFVCFLSSCSSWKKPLTPPPVVLVDEKPKPLSLTKRNTLRTDESVKKYAVGRYVDPSSGLVMHEAHDVYRVEATSKWNRRPLRAASRLRENISQPPHHIEVAQLRQNLRQERANSLAAQQAAETLRVQVEPLAKAVGTAQQLAEQNAQLRKQLLQKNQQPSQPLVPNPEPKNSTDTPDSVKERLRGLFKTNTEKE